MATLQNEKKDKKLKKIKVSENCKSKCCKKFKKGENKRCGRCPLFDLIKKAS